MLILSILICAFIVGLWGWGLNRFAIYCGRRAAQAEAPYEFFTPASDRWLAVLLVVMVGTVLAVLALCIAVLCVIGGLGP